jgi:hypothetical protein
MKYSSISVKPATLTKFQNRFIAYQAELGRKSDNTAYLEYLLGMEELVKKTLKGGIGGRKG